MRGEGKDRRTGTGKDEGIGNKFGERETDEGIQRVDPGIRVKGEGGG
jgi:hypothetical protein